MTSRRVVITGLGILSPLGLGVNHNWNSVLSGKTGFSKLKSDEYKNLPCKIAGKIDSDELFKTLLEKNIIKRSDIKLMSLANIYALAVAHEAINDSDWKPLSEESLFRAGSSIGIGMAGILEVSEAAVAFNKNPDSNKGFKSMSPYFVPKILSNLSSGLISIKYNLKGPSHCVTTACAAGTHSILDAYNFIKNNVSDVMISGATEACIHPVSIGGFCRMRALTTNYNDDPSEASRPFDSKRSGFVMSEGAGCMVLESLDHAKARNAKIYGEILGGAMNADANHITSPSGDGAYRCMKLALKNSNLTSNDISYINCHATSTPAGDMAEFNAVKKIFENSSKQVCLSSFKGQLGHLLGAAGAVETVLTLLVCNKRLIPPSVNIQQLEPSIMEQTKIHVVQSKKTNRK